MGKNKQPTFKDWHKDVAGNYLVAKEHRDYDAEIRIYELNEAQRALLDRTVDDRTGRNMKIGYGAGMPVTLATSALPAVGVPFPIFLGAYLTSLGGMLGYSFKDEIRGAVVHKKQRRTRHEIMGTDQYLSFKKRDINFELPKSILEQEVTFESEEGQVSKPAGQLVESFDGHFSGMSVRENAKEATVTGMVNPNSFMFSVLHYAGKNGGDVLAASQSHLHTMHEAQNNMPRFRPQQSRLPEGLRQEDEAATSALFIGSLGVYGVLRAQIGSQVSTLMADLYTERGTDGVKGDMERLIAPTSANVSWDEIYNAHTYLMGLARERGE